MLCLAVLCLAAPCLAVLLCETWHHKLLLLVVLATTFRDLYIALLVDEKVVLGQADTTFTNRQGRQTGRLSIQTETLYRSWYQEAAQPKQLVYPHAANFTQHICSADLPTISRPRQTCEHTAGWSEQCGGS